MVNHLVSVVCVHVRGVSVIEGAGLEGSTVVQFTSLQYIPNVKHLKTYVCTYVYSID